MKSMPNELLAAPDHSAPMDVQAAAAGLLWYWRKVKNVMILKQVLDVQRTSFCLICKWISGSLFVYSGTVITSESVNQAEWENLSLCSDLTKWRLRSKKFDANCFNQAVSVFKYLNSLYELFVLLTALTIFLLLLEHRYEAAPLISVSWPHACLSHNPPCGRTSVWKPAVHHR